MNFQSIITKAYHSKFHLAILNFAAGFMIPFNKPHDIKILELSKSAIKVKSPFKRSNKNHLNGIHACLLATLCEFCTGFLLISNLDPKQYRLILKSLKVDYLYQAKKDVFALFEIDEAKLITQLRDSLSATGVTEITCDVKITDTDNNHICTGYVTWQIKDWTKVKTKV